METEDLFLRHQSVATAGFSSGAYKPGLDAMKRLDTLLGNPSSAFRTIHVAGTNGKGSVSSMLAASLAAGGLRVGLFTSPHLINFRERMKIISGGTFEMISKEDTKEFLDSYEKDMDGLTFFEVTTGMAFWWFARQHVDMVVIEVGLGGRLDSTNVITPELSVITSIGLDHCALLGSTRAEIAAEKAGIFKKGVPALVWGHDPETDPVFEKAASGAGSPLHYADTLPFEPDSIIRAMDLKSPSQKENLRTVIAALRLLGLEPDIKALCNTASITGLHGRWEKVTARTPSGREVSLILDIGHNPAALESNLSSVKDKVIIIYGVMADKDYRTNIRLLPRDAEMILCSPDTPRALPSDDLAEAFREIAPETSVQCAQSVADAVDKALEKADGCDIATILIIGSTFVVSEAAKHLKLYD